MKLPSGMVSSLGYTMTEAMDGGRLFSYLNAKYHVQTIIFIAVIAIKFN